MTKEEKKAELEIKNDYVWAILCSSLGYFWCLLAWIFIIALVIVRIKVGIILWNSIII